MKEIIFFLFLLVFSSSCKQNIDKNEGSFELFIVKFSNDSLFQINHIDFPLKIVANNAKKEILRKDWKYTNFYKIKNAKSIIKIEKKSSNEYNLIYEIEDTGVHVDHFFKKNSGIWTLYLIKDESD